MDTSSDRVAAAFQPMQERGQGRLRAGGRLILVRCGKVSNRVWLTTGERGLICEPVSLPVLRDGVDELARLIAGSGVDGAP
jgi:hypothetical protein